MLSANRPENLGGGSEKVQVAFVVQAVLRARDQARC